MFIEDKIIISIVGAIVSAAVEIVYKPVSKKIIPYIKNWFEEKIRRGQKKVYDSKAILSTILISMEKIDGVKTAVQQQTKNGGGVPKAGSPVFGSVISPSKYSDTFWNQLLDGTYCQFISRLMTEKRLIVSTHDLPAGCILKDLYQAHNITEAVWYDMAITKSYYNFIVVNLDRPYEQLTPMAKDSIRQYITTVKNILND